MASLKQTESLRNQIDKIIERLSATWLQLLGAVRSISVRVEPQGEATQ